MFGVEFLRPLRASQRFPTAKEWDSVVDICHHLNKAGYLDNSYPTDQFILPNGLFAVQCWADGYLDSGTLYAFNSPNHDWDDQRGGASTGPSITYRCKWLGHKKAEAGKVDQGIIYRGFSAGVLNNSPLVLGEGSTGETPVLRNQLATPSGASGAWLCPVEGNTTSSGWIGWGMFDESQTFVLVSAGERPDTTGCT